MQRRESGSRPESMFHLATRAVVIPMSVLCAALFRCNVALPSKEQCITKDTTPELYVCVLPIARQDGVSRSQR